MTGLCEGMGGEAGADSLDFGGNGLKYIKFSHTKGVSVFGEKNKQNNNPKLQNLSINI